MERNEFTLKKISIVLVILLLVLAACANDDTKESGDKANNYNAPAGDKREKTASMEELPEFLAPHDDNMKSIYYLVSQHKELLEQIPCYCGCGMTEIGHKDNYDCFIHDNLTDGAIVWDDHATRCPACLNIAAESIIEFNEGTSIKDIRQQIDEKYQEGYAEPTPTPGI